MSLYNVLDLNDATLAASVPKKWDGIIQYKLRQLSSLQSAMDSSTKLREPFLLRHDTIYHKMRKGLHGALKRKRPNGHNTSIPYFVIIS